MMNKLAFDLLLDKKNKKYDIAISEIFSGIGLGGILLFLGINWLSDKYFNLTLLDYEFVKYLIYFFSASLIIGIIYGYFDFNGNNRVKKNFITFDENEITINHVDRYDLIEIKDLFFDIGDYKGRFINQHSLGNPNKSYGGDNYVEFMFQEKSYKFQFVIDSKKDMNKLTQNLIPQMQKKAQVKH